jgi:small conductance mechanosensitive channel
LDGFLDQLKSHALSLSREAVGLAEKSVLALVIIIVGVLVARIFRRWLTKTFPRKHVAVDALLENFLLRLSYHSIVGLSIVFALRLFINVETFIAGLGVTGIILGFGLRDTLSNFASGILLLAYRPFRAGETIDVEGTLGVVNELTIVNMRMTTVDGVRVIMPNSKVWGAKITNYSLSERRRLEFTLKLKQQDLEPALSTLSRALEQDERLLKDPKPKIRITAIADGIATITIWAWILPGQFDAAMNDGYQRLSDALDRAGITPS